MNVKFGLTITMKELAASKATRTSGHDIACRIIESMRESLRTATFVNIGDKPQLAKVLHSYKNSLDHGETIDLDNLLSEIVGV